MLLPQTANLRLNVTRKRYALIFNNLRNSAISIQRAELRKPLIY